MRREKHRKRDANKQSKSFRFFLKKGAKIYAINLALARNLINWLKFVAVELCISQLSYTAFLLWGTLLGLYSKYPEIAVMNWLLQIARNHWSITGEICSYRHFGLWSPTNNSKNLARNLEQLS